MNSKVRLPSLDWGALQRRGLVEEVERGTKGGGRHERRPSSQRRKQGGAIQSEKNSRGTMGSKWPCPSLGVFLVPRVLPAINWPHMASSSLE